MRISIPKSSNFKAWLFFGAIIKLLIIGFLYFEIFSLGHYEFDGLFVKGGDTFSYFVDLRKFLDGDGELYACRMPAFLPIYAIPYWLFGESFANQFVIIFQIIFSIVALYYLAKIALMISKSERIFQLTFFAFAISTFTSVYDVFGLADSMGVSTLIFGFYHLLKFEENQSNRSILLSGLFFAWSLFFRQIAAISVLVIGIYLLIKLFKKFPFKEYLLKLILFGLPLLIMMGSWTIYNKSVHKQFIPLVKPVYDCFSSYPKHQLDMLNLPIAWGGVFTKWGGEGEWFTNPKMKKSDFPFTNVFTDEYNLDSLENLRQLHFTYFDPEISEEEKQKIGELVSEKSIRYHESYKQNYPMRYWVVNKIILLRKFLFPKTIENLPLPAKEEMNLFEKLFKAGYLVLFWLVNLLGLIGLILKGKEFNPVQIHIWAITLFLGVMTGWIEQRYYTPVYPFMLIYAVIAVNDIFRMVQLKFKPIKE